MTLSEWTAQYSTKANGMVRGITEHTLADYRKIAARSFLTILGEHPISEIDADHVVVPG